MDNSKDLYDDCVISVYNDIIEYILKDLQDHPEKKEYFDKAKVYVCPLYYANSTSPIEQDVIEKFKGFNVKFTCNDGFRQVIIKE